MERARWAVWGGGLVRGCNGRKVADELHNCSFGTNLRADCDKYKLYKTKYKNPSETKFAKPLSSTTLIKSTTTQVKLVPFFIIIFNYKLINRIDIHLRCDQIKLTLCAKFI